MIASHAEIAEQSAIAFLSVIASHAETALKM
jgi:hypothetical protein